MAINNNFLKTKAVIKLVEIRKTREKGKLKAQDFRDVATTVNLSEGQVRRAWNNFQLYGKPSLSFSSGGLKSANDKVKANMREYFKGFPTTTNPAYTVDDISKLIKEFTFGPYMSLRDFCNKYQITHKRLYSHIRDLDCTGCVHVGNNKKQIFTFENPDGHGKNYPIRQAIRYSRYKKRFPEGELYTIKDPLEVLTYNNILTVLKEWA